MGVTYSKAIKEEARQLGMTRLVTVDFTALSGQRMTYQSPCTIEEAEELEEMFSRWLEKRLSNQPHGE